MIYIDLIIKFNLYIFKPPAVEFVWPPISIQSVNINKKELAVEGEILTVWNPVVDNAEITWKALIKNESPIEYLSYAQNNPIAAKGITTA